MPVPTPEQMQHYVATARRRHRERQSRLKDRRQRALAVARKASVLLKSEFGVSRVVLFGSVLSDSREVEDFCQFLLKLDAAI